MTTLYHGAHTRYVLHVGQCFTDCDETAERYAGKGEVAEIEIDLSALVVVEAAGYDRDTDEAPGDRGYDGDADVLAYDDEDPHGNPHRTWRLVSQRAVDAAR